MTTLFPIWHAEVLCDIDTTIRPRPRSAARTGAVISTTSRHLDYARELDTEVRTVSPAPHAGFLHLGNVARPLSAHPGGWHRVSHAAMWVEMHQMLVSNRNSRVVNVDIRPRFRWPVLPRPLYDDAHGREVSRHTHFRCPPRLSPRRPTVPPVVYQPEWSLGLDPLSFPDVQCILRGRSSFTPLRLSHAALSSSGNSAPDLLPFAFNVRLATKDGALLPLFPRNHTKLWS